MQRSAEGHDNMPAAHITRLRKGGKACYNGGSTRGEKEASSVARMD